MLLAFRNVVQQDRTADTRDRLVRFQPRIAIDRVAQLADLQGHEAYGDPSRRAMMRRQHIEAGKSKVIQVQVLAAGVSDRDLLDVALPQSAGEAQQVLAPVKVAVDEYLLGMR